MVGKGSELASELFGGSTMERLLSERGLVGSVSVDEHKVKHAVRKAMLGVVATALADLALKQGISVVALTDDEEKDIAAVLGSAIAQPVRVRPPRVRPPRVRPPRKRKAEESLKEEECDWAKARPSWEPQEEKEQEKEKEKEKEAESSGEETVLASGPTKESSQAEKDAAKERARLDWMASLLAPA
jgi:hypothetical protein